MMHGQGYYKLSGGYEYEGLFENNRPAKIPTKLIVLTSDELVDMKPQKLEIYEGQHFKIFVKAITEDEQVFQG